LIHPARRVADPSAIAGGEIAGPPRPVADFSATRCRRQKFDMRCATGTPATGAHIKRAIPTRNINAHIISPKGRPLQSQNGAHTILPAAHIILGWRAHHLASCAHHFGLARHHHFWNPRVAPPSGRTFQRLLPLVSAPCSRPDLAPPNQRGHAMITFSVKILASGLQVLSLSPKIHLLSMVKSPRSRQHELIPFRVPARWPSRPTAPTWGGFANHYPPWRLVPRTFFCTSSHSNDMPVKVSDPVLLAGRSEQKRRPTPPWAGAPRPKRLSQAPSADRLAG